MFFAERPVGQCSNHQPVVIVLGQRTNASVRRDRSGAVSRPLAKSYDPSKRVGGGEKPCPARDYLTTANVIASRLPSVASLRRLQRGGSSDSCVRWRFPSPGTRRHPTQHFRYAPLPERMAGTSGRRGPEPAETRPKQPCWGSLALCGLQHNQGRPCAVIVLRPHELRDRRVRDLARLEFRVYAVSSRLKAELRAVPSTCTHRIRMVTAIGMRQHTHLLVASRRQTPGRRPESSSKEKYAKTG